MSSSKYEVTLVRRHMKARRAIRALAAFGLIISVFLIAFDSVALGFGVSNDTVIPVNADCEVSYCYAGAGLWSGVSGIIASIYGLTALRKCNAGRSRHAVYFVLCLFSSMSNAVALLLGWSCDAGLFDCLRYHQASPDTDRALKIMAIMYSCLLLEVFVHSKVIGHSFEGIYGNYAAFLASHFFVTRKMTLFSVVSSNASIGFALYNCCLSDTVHCDTCRTSTNLENHENHVDNSMTRMDNFEIPERIANRTKTRMLAQNDFPKANYTQSLPRYVMLSRGPTNV